MPLEGGVQNFCPNSIHCGNVIRLYILISLSYFNHLHSTHSLIQWVPTLLFSHFDINEY